MLVFIATQEIFMYGNRLYKQTDGVTMKSALEPTSANFYLEHIEELFNDYENST